ncbi:MAG TPA: dihydrofolate reductase family protein [Candidatus Paceibacterota bacterium]
MRKLIMWNVITVDGCFEGEKPWDLAFHERIWGKELEDFGREQVASADMIIYGERTYKGMAEYWTKADPENAETAAALNAIPKIVCSRTLEKAEWNNTTIVRDAVVELAKLKEQGDGNMFVFGSGILSESLMNAGLFDEYRLAVAPVILGKGRHLFTEGTDRQNLKLIESRQLETGGVILKYAPASQI